LNRVFFDSVLPERVCIKEALNQPGRFFQTAFQVLYFRSPHTTLYTRSPCLLLRNTTVRRISCWQFPLLNEAVRIPFYRSSRRGCHRVRSTDVVANEVILTRNRIMGMTGSGKSTVSCLALVVSPFAEPCCVQPVPQPHLL
jgi:hypothetical protein